MRFFTWSKTISFLRAIDIVCEEWQKLTNSTDSEGQEETKLLKELLIELMNHKYKPLTNKEKSFRKNTVNAFIKIKDYQIVDKDLAKQLIEKLFTPKPKNRFLAWFDDKQAFLNVLTPFLIFILTLIFVNKK